MTAREVALKLLLDLDNNGKFANLSLQSPLFLRLSDEERRLTTALFYTAVERRLTLDHLIGALTGRAASSLSDRTRAILRLGLCQIYFLLRIPHHAAVMETVRLCSHEGERRLVNAVLRRAAREPMSTHLPPREKNEQRYLSVAYSFPLPLVRRLTALVGDEIEALLRAFGEVAPLTLFVNPCRTTREAALERLRASGLEAYPTVHAQTGIRVHTDVRATELPGFAEGHLFVQDEASQIEAAVLAPRAGERLIDVCAAPGGKSFAAACLMGDAGEVLSFDLHGSKCSLIEQGAARLGLSSVRVGVLDATVGSDALNGTADRVICDVPCSGLGVLGKKPDLRYKDPAAWERLPALALSILERSAAYVRAGGVLVYSTCTLLPEENRAVVDRFLSTHAEFSLVPFTVGDLSAEDGTYTLYPHRDGTDGFYIAKLCRTGV